MIGMRKESDGFRGGVSCMLNMNLKETFKKQGGMKLLEQYWKNGTISLEDLIEYPDNQISFLPSDLENEIAYIVNEN